MTEENYQQKYEGILRSGIRKAKVVGFLFGYDSHRFRIALHDVERRKDLLHLEMEEKGIDARQLNSRRLLSLDGELFSLNLRKIHAANGLIY